MNAVPPIARDPANPVHHVSVISVKKVDVPIPSIVTIAVDIAKNTVSVIVVNAEKQARKTASAAMFVKNIHVSAAMKPLATDPVIVKETVDIVMNIANVFVVNVMR